MITREVLYHVNKMYNHLEKKEELTEEEKTKYGYRNSWKGRKYYEPYNVKQIIPIIGYGRSQITRTTLKDIKEFLEEAIKYKFYGDTEIRTESKKGLYASTRTGEDKKGQIILYHSFSTGENYWQIKNENGDNISNKISKKNELKKYIKENYI